MPCHWIKSRFTVEVPQNISALTIRYVSWSATFDYLDSETGIFINVNH